MAFTELDFTLKNHVPPGGLRCFDATFTPLAGTLKITVKVCPRLRFYKGTLEESMKKEYLKAFQEKVPHYWTDSFQFKLLKEGFHGLAVKPVCEVVESDLQNAHYDLILFPDAPDDISICVRTGEDPQLAKLRGTKFEKPEFGDYAGKLSAQFTQVALKGEDKAKSVLTQLKDSVEIPVDMKKGNAKFSLNTMEDLRSYANNVQTCFKLWHKAPVIAIQGPGSSGKEVAEDVGRILGVFGLKAKYKYSAKGPDSVVRISADQKQVTNLENEVTSGTYKIPELCQWAVVHEYGHMLGLPDEYICYGEATLGIMAEKSLSSGSKTETSLLQKRVGVGITEGQTSSQTAFMELCRQYGVPVPPFGSKNPSLMSAGHKFLPCHGVTLADALRKMTSKYTTAKDWRIDVLK